MRASTFWGWTAMVLGLGTGWVSYLWLKPKLNPPPAPPAPLASVQPPTPVSPRLWPPVARLELTQGYWDGEGDHGTVQISKSKGKWKLEATWRDEENKPATMTCWLQERHEDYYPAICDNETKLRFRFRMNEELMLYVESVLLDVTLRRREG